MADKKLNEVPVVSDIVTIFGKRSNGEIVQIDKSNLATLLGELLPVASSGKSGLMSGNIMRNRLQSISFGSGRVYKIGHLQANYVGIIFRGADIIRGKIIDFCIFKTLSGEVKAAGTKESWINLKVDSNKYVYIMVPNANIYYASIESYTNYVLDSSISEVDSFPSDAVDIPFT